MLISTIFAAVLLVACSEENTIEENNPIKTETEEIKELVQDYSVRNITAKSVSITSKQLFVTDNDGTEQVYNLPKDEFFVSIAPYINETHPCDNHSLTGCQGEMVSEQFNVYIEDAEGNVLVDDTLITEANGFIDLWLPREQSFQIKIEHQGKTVESEFSTFENDGTCITTMQLV
ncbi:CueP family metal-binding protein [Solibacillus daqui]|uniref:CueP family metal-binding protein n=1 Tax=Solibacillus daqui TaxID=2912187 RepID=UPI002365F034|nr:CueP family metal-binding protein [Solibacillus daqui]